MRLHQPHGREGPQKSRFSHAAGATACGRRNRMQSLISVACENKFSKQKNPNPSPLQERCIPATRRSHRIALPPPRRRHDPAVAAAAVITSPNQPPACCPRRLDRFLRRRRRPPHHVRARSALAPDRVERHHSAANHPASGGERRPRCHRHGGVRRMAMVRRLLTPTSGSIRRPTAPPL